MLSGAIIIIIINITNYFITSQYGFLKQTQND